MGKKSGWALQVGLLLVGGFYLYFGVRMLIGAYSLNNPITFIATFFASNLIILISAALIAGFVYRLVANLRQNSAPPGENDAADPPEDRSR